MILLVCCLSMNACVMRNGKIERVSWGGGSEIKNMEDVEFHFALEGICGKGEKFLLECIKEAKMFMSAKTIDSTKTTYLELYKKMTESTDI